MGWLGTLVRWFKGGREAGATNAQSLQDKARRMIRARRYQDALGCLDRLIELRPDFAGGYHDRAVVRILSRRDFQAALPDCDMAVKRDPKFAQVYVIRSAVHRQLGNQERADGDIRIARTLDKEQADKWLEYWDRLLRLPL